MRVLDLFSGIGGFSLGLERAGFETVAFCETEEYPRKILKKHWPDVYIHDDVRTLSYIKEGDEPDDWILYDSKINHEIIRGAIDVVCGGFPCQDVSLAGRQKGFEGERSSLYSEMLRVIGECGPKYAIFENVTALLTGGSGRWFGQFLYDLAEIGFDAEWHCIPASELGKAHHRDRVWVIAYPNGTNGKGIHFQKPFCANPHKSRRREYSRAVDAAIPADDYARYRKDLDGFPEELGRIKGALKAYGNAVVPQIPELIGRAIMEITGEKTK